MHVEIKNVTKRYDSVPALLRASLKIAPGNVVSIIGLNGAGKTTLLRCLGGIVAPTSGEILFDQQKFHRERLDLRRRLMFLPDFPAGFSHMNVLEHTSLLLRLYERAAPEAEENIMRSLAELDLLPLAEMPMAQLSRGQLYKCALTALFAVNPELWLLDEPLASGLDPQGIATFKQRARTHAAGGGTILYTTQILEIAAKFSDLLVVLDHGGVALTMTRSDLDALPPEGPDSLESRLRQFREITNP